MRPALVPRRLAGTAEFVSALEPIPDVSVTGISLDSRRIEPGDLYAALPGAVFHGAQFAAQAVAAGAVAVLTDPDGARLIGPAIAPLLIVEDPRSVLGAVSAWTYGYPSRDLSVAGITGTDGKTTTAMMLEAGLQGAGRETGLIGTVVTRIGNEEMTSVRTTPEAPDLQALLAVMRERGVTDVAMEVSSHALALGRVDGVEFALAVFTNLGHDHLDFHQDQERYFQAKASLFSPLLSKRGLICVDDEWGVRLAEQTLIPAQTYSVASPDISRSSDPDWTGAELAGEGVGYSYRLCGPNTDLPAATSLPGVFNVRNAVAASAAAITLGGDPEAVVRAIAQRAGVPGRMESVNAGQEFTVLVDYAHTPDAVGRALDVGREVAARRGGRLVAVLGCGGDRDREKRPMMGEVAARLADVVVITDDNPRSEDPSDIRKEIVGGAMSVPAGQRADVIDKAGREIALMHAVRLASPGDVVMALGKGHEQGQEIDGVIHPMDDRVILRSAIEDAARAGAR